MNDYILYLIGAFGVLITLLIIIFAPELIQRQRAKHLSKRLDTQIHGETLKNSTMLFTKKLPIWELELATGQIKRANALKVVNQKGKVTKSGVLIKGGFHYLQAMNKRTAKDKFKKELLAKYK